MDPPLTEPQITKMWRPNGIKVCVETTYWYTPLQEISGNLGKLIRTSAKAGTEY